MGQPLDKVGLATSINNISSSCQQSLSTGGLGVNIGNGTLSYRPGSNRQFIANPGYNNVRGPVSIGFVRLHMEL